LPEGDWRRTNPRFQGENFARNLALVEHIETLAREKGCTPAQLALAWVLARGEDVVPIPGVKTRARLEENAAAGAVTLSDDDLRRIDSLAPRGVAAGDRYPEAAMKRLNR
jgi:aryl-alcohol dehydrogenase-like predicted oxidoreductase